MFLLFLIVQHPKICEFPSNEFYDGQLVTDRSVLQQFCSLEEFWPRDPNRPIVFCDVIEGKEEDNSSHDKVHQDSKSNRPEAVKIVSNKLSNKEQCVMYLQVEIIIAMIKAKRSRKKYPNIAILTPYKAQKKLMEDLVKEQKLEVTVSTINESQGEN